MLNAVSLAADSTNVSVSLEWLRVGDGVNNCSGYGDLEVVGVLATALLSVTFREVCTLVHLLQCSHRTWPDAMGANKKASLGGAAGGAKFGSGATNCQKAPLASSGIGSFAAFSSGAMYWPMPLRSNHLASILKSRFRSKDQSQINNVIAHLQRSQNYRTLPAPDLKCSLLEKNPKINRHAYGARC